MSEARGRERRGQGGDGEARGETRPRSSRTGPTARPSTRPSAGPRATHTYEEGPEKKLGPSGVRHHEDGSVSIDGEKVDNPDEYKGDPIPGGPTDPNAPR